MFSCEFCETFHNSFFTKHSGITVYKPVLPNIDFLQSTLWVLMLFSATLTPFPYYQTMNNHKRLLDLNRGWLLEAPFSSSTKTVPSFLWNIEIFIGYFKKWNFKQNLFQCIERCPCHLEQHLVITMSELFKCHKLLLWRFKSSVALILL